MKKITIFLFLIFIAFLWAEKKEWCGTQEALRVFRMGEKIPRPPDGPKYVYSTHFIIHFDTIGTNATTRAYAESLSKYMEYSWAKQIDTLGWASPPPDGAGPDDRYDVYIRDLGLYVMGRTVGEYLYTNPYPDGATSYMEIAPGLSFRDLRVVSSHEFNHASQLRYSYLEDDWWQENCATWMEDVCYDNENQYMDYLSWSIDPLDSPHKPITCDEDLYEYAGCLWPMFLAECYAISCPRRAWERMGQVSGENTLSGINDALGNFASNLTNALKEYGLWRYFTGTRADPTHYFSESNLWPPSSVLRNHNSYPATGDQGNRYPSGPGGTNYIQFSAGGTNYLRMVFDGEDNYLWSGYAIGYKTPPSDTYGFVLPYPWNRGIKTVSFSGHSHIALAVTVTQWQGSANNLTFTYKCSLRTVVYNWDVGVAEILSPPNRVKKDSLFSPKIRVENYGLNSASFPVWFIIVRPPAETIYKETASVNNLPPDGWQEISFPQVSIPIIGFYAISAHTALSGDENSGNDELAKNLEIYSPITGWEKVADVPFSPDGKAVKSGGGLAVIDDTTIFVLKGNNKPSLYRFNPLTNGIAFIGNLRYGGEDLKIKKGGFILAGGDYIYIVPGGNKSLFYRAPKTNPLSLTSLSQIPGVALKGGTGMVYCEKNGRGCIYLLKGSKTKDFYLYDVMDNTWEVKQSAPAYSSPDKGYQIGSAITFDGNQTIYCLRAKYNELHKYDITSDAWVSGFSSILPFTHPTVGRKRYVKEGGAIVFANNKLYAFKGGNSNEFWVYDIGANNWSPAPFLPSGSENKGVKGGGFLVYQNGYIFALKGNNTTGLWRYSGGTGDEFLAKNFSSEEFGGTSQPILSEIGVPFLEVKVYNPLGRLVAEKEEALKNLPAGVYLVEVGKGKNRKVKKVFLISR
ncbi:MAG: T9SS type A sorting domain-containing protein [candidate division WOR-3 bacterium]